MTSSSCSDLKDIAILKATPICKPSLTNLTMSNNTDNGDSFSIQPHPAVSHHVFQPPIADLTMSITQFTENKRSYRSSVGRLGVGAVGCVEHPGNCHSPGWFTCSFGRFLKQGWVNGSWYNYWQSSKELEAQQKLLNQEQLNEQKWVDERSRRDLRCIWG